MEDLLNQTFVFDNSKLGAYSGGNKDSNTKDNEQEDFTDAEGGEPEETDTQAEGSEDVYDASRPFICEICRKGCKTIQGLNSHMRLSVECGKKLQAVKASNN